LASFDRLKADRSTPRRADDVAFSGAIHEPSGMADIANGHMRQSGFGQIKQRSATHAAIIGFARWLTLIPLTPESLATCGLV
jgi:hypothetical protein